MIPKKIHYCWFGGNPLPQDALMCIESWKKYFPDYEIIEWNEKNFDMNSCDYIREAAEKKNGLLFLILQDLKYYTISAEFTLIQMLKLLEILMRLLRWAHLWEKKNHKTLQLMSSILA